MASRRDVELERRPIPEPMYRTPLFLGLPQHYLVVWLATLASAAVAVGSGTHFLLGIAVFALGMAAVHPKLARACEEDALAIDVFFHWLLNEHAFSEPHPSIWDPADRVRPSIPQP
ncbi:MAG TPA: hypothetical protein VF746_26290 [Longimicrobium sp.]